MDNHTISVLVTSVRAELTYGGDVVEYHLDALTDAGRTVLVFAGNDPAVPLLIGKRIDVIWAPFPSLGEIRYGLPQAS